MRRRPVFLNEEILAVKNHWQRAKALLLDREVRVRTGKFQGVAGKIIQVRMTQQAEVRALVKLDFKPGNKAHAPKLLLDPNELELTVSQ